MRFSSLVRVCLLASLAGGTVVPTVFAQPAAEWGTGPWAIQFRIEDDFQLTTFRGALFSVKHQASPRSSWRLGAALDFQDRSRTATVDTLVSEEDTGFSRLELTVEYLRYADPDSRVKFFFGGGVLGGYSRSTSDFDAIRRLSSWSWHAGLNGLLGVEWFMTKNLSLHGEYGLSLRYIKSEGEQTPPSGLTRFQEESVILLDDRGVLFGLSVYF